MTGLKNISTLKEIQHRRQRDKLFPSIFADPAWDMLLDLHQNGRTYVSSLCVASKVPTTTALRYIDKLIAHDLANRMPHEFDRRMIMIELTARGAKIMTEMFHA